MTPKNTFLKSLTYALRGIAYAWASERNFRIQVVVAVLVMVGGFLIKISWVEGALLALAISTVFILELLNTVIERMMDALSPRMHPYATVVKDLMAGAVLIASIGAVVVGFSIGATRMIH